MKNKVSQWGQAIADLLPSHQHPAIHLGLDRIKQLLARLGNPQDRVRVIHVAGTNGKGSVCAYISSILQAAGYRVGRYTSPHLQDWTERICINGQNIASEDLYNSLVLVLEQVNPEDLPTQFEVFTAAAWLYFAERGCDVAVMEVGLGGRLDATNVCDRPLASIIVSIGWDHWQVLGPTLGDIAREKAGILKPHCPAIIGALQPEAQTVIEQRIQELNCPALYPRAAEDLGGGRARFGDLEYQLPLVGAHQLQNSAVAIATIQALPPSDWQISPQAIQQGIAHTRWPGRLEWSSWKQQRILIDGAHNPESAMVLRHYLDSLETTSIHWVMGMISTKSHQEIFEILLRPGDLLFTVPVPDSNCASPEALLELAQTLQPNLSACAAYRDLQDALDAAVIDSSGLIVLSGSLYLLGYYFSLHR
ncbi:MULTISPECIES: folylpolyglutamate synthase/dihydrofolate synthase family protein [unclassified Roseofilum]|uniref:bifunctional folylpolyglutamate synthase/dihydrofolate synthase n=1 Tax=unclassified Roseofilum TaxID=2620099 RepID=UPI00298E6297|nr:MULTISPECIES: folylpolyglutamate synthase/dihydrofolate synthase family protein [unclassified Roseofilum]